MNLERAVLLALSLTISACGPGNSRTEREANRGDEHHEPDVTPVTPSPIKPQAPEGPSEQLVGPSQSIVPVTYRLVGAGDAPVGYAFTGTGCDTLQIEAATGVVSGRMGEGNDQTCNANVVARVGGKEYAVGKLSVRVPAKFREWCDARYGQGLTAAQKNTVEVIFLELYARYLEPESILIQGEETDCPRIQALIDEGKATELALCAEHLEGCDASTYWGTRSKLTDAGPIATMTSVTTLDVRGNELVDLTPIKGLTQVFWLTISDNGITSLSPISGWTALKSLEAIDNRIDDVSPLKDSAIIRLHLDGNPVATSKTAANCPTDGSSLGIKSFCSL